MDGTTARHLDVVLLGRTVRLVAAEPAALDDVAAFFAAVPEQVSEAPALIVHLEPGRGWVVDDTSAVDDEVGGRIAAARSPFALAGALCEWAATGTREHCVFHAGAVRSGSGAWLLVGPSGSGKTTLTAGLGRRGFELFSDEVGALDLATRRIVPFPRHAVVSADVLALLGLDADTGSALGRRERLVRAEELGARRATGAAPLERVVLPSFERRASAGLEPLRAAEAVLALAASCCSLRGLGAHALDTLIDVARDVPCERLVYGELGDALHLLLPGGTA